MRNVKTSYIHNNKDGLGRLSFYASLPKQDVHIHCIFALKCICPF